MSFSTKDADTVLTKLKAEPLKGKDHVVGIVSLTTRHRIRLYYSHGRKDLPSFVEHKWKQDLRLKHGEWADLKRCPLSGEDALALTKGRLGL